MTRVIMMHRVGNFEKWLASGESRNAILSTVCDSHRLYRHATESNVVIAMENVDMEKLKAVASLPNAVKSEIESTAIQPIDIFFEIEGN